jgi:hypothetical protein
MRLTISVLKLGGNSTRMRAVSWAAEVELSAAPLLIIPLAR